MPVINIDKNEIDSEYFIAPLIKRFQDKNRFELLKDVEVLRRNFKLICYDFSEFETMDVNHLRQLVLLLQVLYRTLEKALGTEKFDFSWKEVINNLLHLEKNPDLMIRSMLREIKRINSFKARVSVRDIQCKPNYKIIKMKQTTLYNYI